MSRRAALVTVVCVLALALASAVAADDFRSLYADAMKSVDKGNWAEAEGYLRRAVAANPNEDGKKVKLYGTRFVPYLPHYHLGVARATVGDCAGALAAFAESERQGVIQGQGADYNRLVELRGQCQQQLPAATTAPTAAPRPTVPPTPPPTPTVDVDRLRRLEQGQRTAEQAIAAAAEAEKIAAKKRGDQAFAPVWQRDARLATSIDAAAAKLGRARQRLAAGVAGQDQAALAEAAELADAARQALATAAAGADAQLLEIQAAGDAAKLEQARQASLAVLGRQLDPARRAVAAAGQLSAAGQRAVAGERAAVEAALRSAEGASGAALSPAQVEAVRGELERASGELARAVAEQLEAERTAATSGAATPTPPAPGPAERDPLAPLRRGAAALLAADYTAAEAALAEISLEAPRARALAYLVRAAARHASFLVGGGRDAALEQGARADVAACRQADPALVPDAGYFSPSFVAYFAGR